jgi:hypothetical protein
MAVTNSTDRTRTEPGTTSSQRDATSCQWSVVSRSASTSREPSMQNHWNQRRPDRGRVYRRQRRQSQFGDDDPHSRTLERGRGSRRGTARPHLLLEATSATEVCSVVNGVWAASRKVPGAGVSSARTWSASAILLHTLPVSAQCDYNAAQRRGLS